MVATDNARDARGAHGELASTGADRAGHSGGTAILLAGGGPPLVKAPPRAALDRIAITNTEIARLPAPTVEAAARATFKPAELPFTDCCTTASFAARLHFTLHRVPENGLGVLSTLQVDNYILQANGSTIVAEGRMVSRADDKPFATWLSLLCAAGDGAVRITVADSGRG